MKRPDPVTELLDAEAASARATMSRSLVAVKGAAAQVADPREWVRAHPWATLGVTAAAGFVAAPGKEQWHWGARSVAPKSRNGEARDGDGSNEPEPPHMGWKRPILLRLADVITFGVLRSIVSVVSTRLAALIDPAPEASEN